MPLCDGKNIYARAKWMTEHLQTHVLKLTSEAIGLSAGIAERIFAVELYDRLGVRGIGCMHIGKGAR